MLVVMETSATEEQLEHVIDRMMDLGFDVHRSSGMTYTVLGGIGETEPFDVAAFRHLPGVKEAIRITTNWKLAAKKANPGGTRVRIGAVEVGGAETVRLPAGAVLREVRESSQVRVLAAHADGLVVPGAAMQNEALLKEMGRAGIAVLLKNGEAATLNEWLSAADMVLRAGNPNVVLCASALKSYSGRMLDVGVIAEVREVSHLPVIAAPGDVSDHGWMAEALGRAALAAGAHGLLE